MSAGTIMIAASDKSESSSSGTSRSLIARVRADEPDAWERLVRLYGPLVLHWCRGRGLQDQDIADIFQDIFESVIKHVGYFRREQSGDTFRGWLRRITQNKIIDHFRRLGRDARAAGGSSVQVWWSQLPEPKTLDAEPPIDDAETGLFARVLALIRDEFEPRTWQAFWQTAVSGRDTADVGADLSMSPGAVRVAKARVLRRLREELGDLPT